MKKVLLTIISVCLIAASIFGLFAGVSSFSDIMNVKEYKEKDAEEGLEAIETLNDGLDQLQEAEGTYLAGVDTYTAGLIAYSEGKTQLSAGYAAYYAGKKQLEEGKAAYAAGKKQIADNTQAYNEGKATLAKIEPLMPYVNQYVEFRDGTIANLAGFSNAQAWFVSVVRPIAAKQGLNIPADVTDLPAYVQQMVADGKAQLKQYEDGLVQLAEAEKAIAAGEAQLRDAEKQLAQGENDLAAGGNQLADGKKQLNTFEDGCAQVAAGCELLLTQPAYMNNEGNGDKKMCPSVADILKERYGDNFSIWELDDNGEVRVVNGCQYLNLENCRAVGQAGKDYIEVYQTAAVTKGENLFPRLDMDKALEELEAAEAAAKKAALPAVEVEPQLTEKVDFDTFCKSDFRAVKVKACDAVKKSEKLLRFTLDDGTGVDRQILSGIHKWYEPEDLVGKTLIAIVNLPPRKMMGLESNGMLISAVHTEHGEECLHLIMVDDSIPAGAKLC